MSNFTKELHDPMKLFEAWWPNVDVSHITYDPDMKASEREYWRIEQSGGDGTAMFTIEMLQKTLVPFLNRSTSYIPTNPEIWDDVKEIKYTIGKIRHVTVFGAVELRCGGTYQGQRERVRIPVRCEYVCS
jgi:hypothetical protein